MNEPVPQSTATLEELLEHLNDLAQLAANEGFLAFAEALDTTATIVRRNPDVYGARFDAPPARPSVQ